MQESESKRSIYQMMDNEELEEFKYEFDLRHTEITLYYNGSLYLFMGYVFLHQLLKNDIVYLTNEELIQEFKESLEENEIFAFRDNKFIFKLNKITDEVIEYIKMMLKYLLILYTDFNVDYINNEITFLRIRDENYD